MFIDPEKNNSPILTTSSLSAKGIEKEVATSNSKKTSFFKKMAYNK